MGPRVRHTSAAAARTDAASFTGEGHEPIVAARVAVVVGIATLLSPLTVTLLIAYLQRGG